MEDEEGDKKTVTVSFTIYEDSFDAGDRAVLEALVDREMKMYKEANERKKKRGEPLHEFTKLDALSAVVFKAFNTLADRTLGVDKVDKIMEEGIRKHREMTSSSDDTLDP